MDCADSFKSIINKLLTKEKIKENTPILYFNEETNKKEWVVPNFYSDEDFVFDYEKDIPLFFNTDCLRSLINKCYSILNFQKEGYISYGYSDKSDFGLKYTNFSLSKDDFYYSNHNLYSKNLLTKDCLLNKYINLNNGIEYKMLMPVITKLEEEETIKLLKKIESNFTLDDIKNKIKKYENEPLISDINIQSMEVKNTSVNHLFVSKSLKIKNKNESELNSLNLFTDENGNIKETYETVYSEYNDLNLLNVKTDGLLLKRNLLFKKATFKEKISENIKTIKSQSGKEYLTLTKEGIQTILPKKIDVFEYHYGFINPNIENTINILNKGNGVLVEDEMVVFSQESFSEYGKKNFILDLKKSFVLNNNNQIQETGIKNEIVLLHNDDGELFVLDSAFETIKSLEHTKKLQKLPKQIVEFLSLNKVRDNLDIFLTDNKTYMFHNVEFIRNFPKYTRTQANDFIENKKTEDGDYNFDYKMLVGENRSGDYVYSIKNIEKTKFTNVIRNGEMKFNLIEVHPNLEVLNLKYVLKSSILENLKNKNIKDFSFVKYYVKEICMNGIKLEGDFVEKFYDLFFNIKHNKFVLNLNSDKKIYTLEMSQNNDGGKYVYVKNDNLDLALMKNIKSDVNNTLLVKAVKNDKIKHKINKQHSQMYLTNNEIFVEGEKEVKVINYDYKLTTKTKDSLLFNENDNIIYDKNGNQNKEEIKKEEECMIEIKMVKFYI